MKLTLEPTALIAQLNSAEGLVSARIWQGEDEQGTPVHAYIVRVGVPDSAPLEAHARFAAELIETVKPRPDLAALSLRLIV